MVRWRFGASLPAARVSSDGGLRKETPTSFETRIANFSSRVTLTLPLLSATLEWRAGCAERCKSGSGRRGREIVRLRPVSHSTPNTRGLAVPGGHSGLGHAARVGLASVDYADGGFLCRGRRGSHGSLRH